MTRERLDEFSVLSNGFKHVDAQMVSAWGAETFGDDPDQYSHVKKEDLDGMVRKLEQLLGSTAAEVQQKASMNNPFGPTAGAAPWDVVENVGKHGLDDFIRTHVDGLQTDEINEDE